MEWTFYTEYGVFTSPVDKFTYNNIILNETEIIELIINNGVFFPNVNYNFNYSINNYEKFIPSNYEIFSSNDYEEILKINFQCEQVKIPCLGFRKVEKITETIHRVYIVTGIEKIKDDLFSGIEIRIKYKIYECNSTDDKHISWFIVSSAHLPSVISYIDNLNDEFDSIYYKYNILYALRPIVYSTEGYSPEINSNTFNNDTNETIYDFNNDIIEKEPNASNIIFDYNENHDKFNTFLYGYRPVKVRLNDEDIYIPTGSNIVPKFNTNIDPIIYSSHEHDILNNIDDFYVINLKPDDTYKDHFYDKKLLEKRYNADINNFINGFVFIRENINNPLLQLMKKYYFPSNNIEIYNYDGEYIGDIKSDYFMNIKKDLLYDDNIDRIDNLKFIMKDTDGNYVNSPFGNHSSILFTYRLGGYITNKARTYDNITAYFHHNSINTDVWNDHLIKITINPDKVNNIFFTKLKESDNNIELISLSSISNPSSINNEYYMNVIFENALNLYDRKVKIDLSDYLDSIMTDNMTITSVQQGDIIFDDNLDYIFIGYNNIYNNGISSYTDNCILMFKTKDITDIIESEIESLKKLDEIEYTDPINIKPHVRIWFDADYTNFRLPMIQHVASYSDTYYCFTTSKDLVIVDLLNKTKIISWSINEIDWTDKYLFASYNKYLLVMNKYSGILNIIDFTTGIVLKSFDLYPDDFKTKLNDKEIIFANDISDGLRILENGKIYIKLDTVYCETDTYKIDYIIGDLYIDIDWDSLSINKYETINTKRSADDLDGDEHWWYYYYTYPFTIYFNPLYLNNKNIFDSKNSFFDYDCNYMDTYSTNRTQGYYCLSDNRKFICDVNVGYSNRAICVTDTITNTTSFKVENSDDSYLSFGQYNNTIQLDELELPTEIESDLIVSNTNVYIDMMIDESILSDDEFNDMSIIENDSKSYETTNSDYSSLDNDEFNDVSIIENDSVNYETIDSDYSSLDNDEFNDTSSS